MSVGRVSFVVKYRRKTATGTADYRTACSCIPRVADFLDIKDKQYTPSINDVVPRAAYDRTYVKADGTDGTVSVPAGEIVYKAPSKAGARKVSLTTGKKTSKGNRRQIHFTFPSFLSVAEIADILGELIPTSKIATTDTIGASEIAPFFTIKGGGTYPIAANAVAAGTVNPDVAMTEAEQASLLAATESKKKKVIP